MEAVLFGKKLSVLGLFLCWLPTQAMAQTVEVSIDDNAISSVDLSGASSNLEATIGDDLNLVDQVEFLNAMADAALLASKGMGVDYASNPGLFVVGGSFGSAVDSAGFAFGRKGKELPDSGFSLQASAMAGINLGLGSTEGLLNRSRLYANWMTFETQGESFGTSVSNHGVHLQVQLIKNRQLVAAEWGGLAFTTGYELARYTLSLNSVLPIEAADQDLTLEWDATGTYQVSSTVRTIPFELSTNLRLLAFTVFGGVGLDLVNEGVSISEASLGGDVFASGGGLSERLSVGSATVSMTEQGAVSTPSTRIFAGAQMDVMMVKIYGHANIGFNDNFGGHVGLRVAI